MSTYLLWIKPTKDFDFFYYYFFPFITIPKTKVSCVSYVSLYNVSLFYLVDPFLSLLPLSLPLSSSLSYCVNLLFIFIYRDLRPLYVLRDLYKEGEGEWRNEGLYRVSTHWDDPFYLRLSTGARLVGQSWLFHKRIRWGDCNPVMALVRETMTDGVEL